MGLPNETSPLALGSTGGYEIEQSLRFNSADSAYINRTFGTPTDNKKWTFSCWIKRSQLSVFATAAGAISLFVTQGAGAQSFFGFSSNVGNDLAFGYGGYVRIVTTGEFRDLSAWYHIVLVFDSANATPADRAIIYINGTRASVTTPNAVGLNDTTLLNSAVNTGIGKQTGQSWVSMDMYLAEVNFIDGSALDPTRFGKFDDNGVWIPKFYSGSYGNNGFYLTFADNSDITATTLGKDYSGNGNNWTPNGFSVTAGAGNDVLSDTPTTNYCTWNPLDTDASRTTAISLANGNLDATISTYSTVQYVFRCATFASNGKDYFEVTKGDSVNKRMYLGFLEETGVRSGPGSGGTPLNFYGYGSGDTVSQNTAFVVNNASIPTSGLPTVDPGTSGDVIMVAHDRAAKKIWFGKNGTWFTIGGTVGDPETGTAPAITYTTDLNLIPVIGPGSFVNSTLRPTNFGQRPFAYTPPTGFNALNTSNLSAPNIADGSDYFDTVLWTGDGTADRAFTSVLDFQPNFSWIKSRSNAENHVLQDSVRGLTGTNGLQLNSNNRFAEGNNGNGHIGEYTSSGFTLSDGTSGTFPRAGVNQNTYTYVGGFWKEGVVPGFDIVTYTGDGTTSSSRLIDHNLGVTPDFIITKKRSSGTTDYGWSIWHKDLGGNYGVWLNLTNGRNISMWAGYTNFSSTKFTPPNLLYGNENNQTYVNYLWSEVEGFSKFGKYTGNGNSDGPFVFLNFKPAYLLIKRFDTTNDWVIKDASRNAYNAANLDLYANTSQAEVTFNQIDFTSNGFKIRNSNASDNASGGSYIFAAFAENPYGGDGVSPATAR